MTLVRHIAPTVASRFDGEIKGQLVFPDDATRAIIEGSHDDLSAARTAERSTEQLPDGTVVEVVDPQEHHDREKAERAALSA